MIRSPYATKYTLMHQNNEREPTNEPYVNRKASEKDHRRAMWIARKEQND